MAKPSKAPTPVTSKTAKTDANKQRRIAKDSAFKEKKSRTKPAVPRGTARAKRRFGMIRKEEPQLSE